MSDQPAPPTPPSSSGPPPSSSKPKRKRPPSRSQRWADAVSEAQTAFAEIMANIEVVEQALEELKEVQQEYSDWKDNLPENLASSPLGEKLEEVCNLDFESAADAIRSAADDAENVIAEAEGIDLPRGFGRD